MYRRHLLVADAAVPILVAAVIVVGEIIGDGSDRSGAELTFGPSAPWLEGDLACAEDWPASRAGHVLAAAGSQQRGALQVDDEGAGLIRSGDVLPG